MPPQVLPTPRRPDHEEDTDVAKEESSASRAHPEVAAGDPFIAAGRVQDRDCPSCFGGYVTLSYEDADGHEVFEPVRCRRCSDNR